MKDHPAFMDFNSARCFIESKCITASAARPETYDRMSWDIYRYLEYKMICNNKV